MLSHVQPHDARAVLEAVRPQVEKALSSGQGDATTYEAGLAAIEAGESSLWAVHEGDAIRAVIVLTALSVPAGRKLHVELLAGEGMDEWGDEVEAALEQCRQMVGAFCIESSCRPGLARYLKRRGWRQKAVVMEGP